MGADRGILRGKKIEQDRLGEFLRTRSPRVGFMVSEY